ncbi:MAG TPA: formylglycine-generating enzyme family protein [Gemmataceae bacterium]|nr:formylglycine-generating enzyme family protein [Gemmataceae bacterium]
MTKVIALAMVALVLVGASWTVGQDATQPKAVVNSIGMKFVRIEPGEFVMGSSGKEKGRGDDEIQRRIKLTRGFYLGVHTVTQEQWQKVMGNNPSGGQADKNLPVDNVSWNDCQAFCKKLGAMEKRTYRLPTEAEWEYACRAGTTTAFSFGATLATDQANYNGDFIYGPGKKGVNRQKTTPVGSFPANAWGLHDMHGNVWQWCQDWHGGYAAKDVIDPQGPKSGKNRVLRGGSWGSHPIFCRSANRNFAAPDTRTEYYGCRVCFD